MGTWANCTAKCWRGSWCITSITPIQQDRLFWQWGGMRYSRLVTLGEGSQCMDSNAILPGSEVRPKSSTDVWTESATNIIQCSLLINKTFVVQIFLWNGKFLSHRLGWFTYSIMHPLLWPAGMGCMSWLDLRHVWEKGRVSVSQNHTGFWCGGKKDATEDIRVDVAVGCVYRDHIWLPPWAYSLALLWETISSSQCQGRHTLHRVMSYPAGTE